MPISFPTLGEFYTAFKQLREFSTYLPAQVIIRGQGYDINPSTETVTVSGVAARSFTQNLRHLFAPSSDVVARELKSALFLSPAFLRQSPEDIHGTLQHKIHRIVSELTTSNKLLLQQLSPRFLWLLGAFLSTPRDVIQADKQMRCLLSLRGQMIYQLEGIAPHHPARNILLEGVEQLDKAINSLIRSPNYDSGWVSINNTSTMKVALDIHDEALKVTREELTRTGNLIVPEQTRIDLLRSNFRLQNEGAAGEFNSQTWLMSRSEDIEVEAEKAILQEKLEQIVQNFLIGLSQRSQMQTLVRLNQTELNRIYADVQSCVTGKLGDWGVLAKSGGSFLIDVTRTQKSVVIEYTLSFQPVFDCGRSIIKYEGASSVVAKTQIIIVRDSAPVYGPTYVRITLDQGV